MKKKSLFLVLLLFVLTQKDFAQDTVSYSGTFSLKQCVEMALKNNIDVNRSDLLMQDSKVSLSNARGNRLPFVSGDITHTLSQGRAIDPFTNGYVNQNLSSANYSLGASLNLWNAGSINNYIKSSKLNYQASQMDLQQQKDNITINVILAYLQVLNNEEQLNAIMQQADVTRKQVERLEILNKDGAIAPSTYYDTKGQLASDEISIVNQKNALETSKVDLAALMNIFYSKDMALEKMNIPGELVLYDGTSQQIYQQALQNLALVKAANLRQQSATTTVKSAKGQMYPSLVLNGGLGTNYSNAASTSSLIGVTDVPTDNYVLVNNEKISVYSPQSNYAQNKISYGDQWKNNFNSYVSIGISIPILNGFQARNRVTTAKIDEKRTTIEAKTTKTQLQQVVEQAYINMNSSYEKYLKLATQVEDFGESFRAAEIKFNAGVLTSVDYFLIKGSYDRSNINLIAAKYDYMLRTKILDFYQGKLSL